MTAENARLSHADHKVPYGTAGDLATPKHFPVRWSKEQWELLISCSLTAAIAIGVLIALCWFKITSQRDIPLWSIGMMLVLAAVSAFGALVPNAPTELCFDSDNGTCELHFYRRLRSRKCRDLKEVIGIREVGGLSRSLVTGTPAAAAVEAGYETWVPTWELFFADGYKWVFSLQDHEDFLKALSQVCLSTNHPLSAELLNMTGRGV
eukprot:TRINITY_DN40610_c0_g1_i1.p1 TRINITY_DN40610_c0_g1~~TRINITY_DN40610_c0_g1_i1.p1  ORF type:complete len:207 (-),score=14.94 TRINITY_DN40610_c0_g1_i1:78-698(-)